MNHIKFYIKTFVLSLFLAQFCTSCSKDTPNVNEQESTLSLTTANGKRLATSMSALKAELAVDVADKFGTDIDFTITEIEHHSVNDKNYVALIYYKTDNGIESNIMFSDVSFGDENSTFVRLKSGSESDPQSITWFYHCHLKPNRTCSQGCFVKYKRTNPQSEPYCSCADDCEMRIDMEIQY